jgi:hypothetical protein
MLLPKKLVKRYVGVSGEHWFNDSQRGQTFDRSEKSRDVSHSKYVRKSARFWGRI